MTRLLRAAPLGGLCMSATPGACLFDVPARDRFVVSYAEGVEGGHLVPYRIEVPLLTRNDAGAWAEHLALKPSLLPAMVVVDSIAAIHAHMDACGRAGLVAETIHSRAPYNTKRHRRDVQQRLRSPAAAHARPLDVIVVVKCCLEGLDLPLLRGVAFAHMPASMELVIQAALRASRVSDDPHKLVAVVLAPLVVGGAADAQSAQDAALRLDSGNYAPLSTLCRGLAQLEGCEGCERRALERVRARCHVDFATRDRALAAHGSEADLEATCAGRTLGSLADELLERVVRRRPLDAVAYKVARTLRHLVDHEGKLPPRKQEVDGFDMGQFWSNHMVGRYRDAFEQGLKENEAARPYYDRRKAAYEAERAKRAELPVAEKVARTLRHLVDHEGALPPQGTKVDGFRMGKFWSDHMQGQNRDAFEQGLRENEAARPHYDRRKAAYKAKRAKRTTLPVAERVARTLRHLVDHEGALPPPRTKVDDFDMSKFWSNHMQGRNRDAFEQGLSENEAARPYYDRRKAAYEADRAKRAEREKARGTKRKQECIGE